MNSREWLHSNEITFSDLATVSGFLPKLAEDQKRNMKNERHNFGVASNNPNIACMFLKTKRQKYFSYCQKILTMFVLKKLWPTVANTLEEIRAFSLIV